MSAPYIIKSFRGGVSDENDKGIVGSFKHGYGLDIHKRNDSLTCKNAAATVLGEDVGVLGSVTGTIMTGIVNVFLPISDGSTLAFTDRGSIWCRSGDQQWQFVYNDENGKIIGAGEWEDDDGNDYIVWATQTAIARKLYPGSFTTAPDTGNNRWDDATAVWKTEFVSQQSPWHTMKSAGGAFYIANGESLAEISFTDFAWDPITLNVRPGNLINTLEERDDYIILGSEKEGGDEEGHLWSWISTSLNPVQKKKIPVQGINSLIYTELPLMQGGSDGEIFFSDFNSVIPQHSIPGGGTTTPHGVTIENDLAVFGIFAGDYPGIWSYGRRNKNRSFSLNYDYRLVKTINGSSISTIAAIVMANGDLLASWGTTDGSTSEYGIDQIRTTTKATAIYEGLEFDGGSPQILKKFNNVMISMAPLPTGTSLSVKYKVNNQSTWEYAITGANSTTFNTTNATGAEFILGDVGYNFEIGLELNPSGSSTPEIHAITTWVDGMQYEHGGINYPNL